MFELRRDEHDPMLTNGDARSIAELIDKDYGESPRARKLAQEVLEQDFEELYDEQVQLNADMERDLEKLQERLDAANEAGDVFRALLRDLSRFKSDDGEFEEEIAAALADHPSDEEIAAAEAQRKEFERLQTIRYRHGDSAAALMGKPAVFEFREYRARTWIQYEAVAALDESHLLECSKYIARRGKEVSESRWVKA